MSVATGVLLAFVLGARPSEREARDMKTLTAIPSEVEAIVCGGYWREGEADGRYRVFVINEGWEHVHSRVYVQWLQTEHEARSERVVHTVRIRELDSGGLWSLGVPVFLPVTSPPTQVRLDASDVTREQGEAHFFLSLMPGGTYHFAQAKKKLP